LFVGFEAFEICDLMQHLAGPEHGDHRESSSGPDPDSDPNKPTVHYNNSISKHSRFSRNGDKPKGALRFHVFALSTKKKHRKLEKEERKRRRL
jgi:hypothetical protein